MTSDQEEVARTFERYNLTSAPVVDPDQRLVGVITADDVVEVIQEEASEDILRLGGVAGESVSDPVWQTTKHRFIWLFVNLGTAILASWVISLFDATIEQMVALAVLMPIVASMGGNAGTQTMTVAVRALATQDLGAVNAARVIGRETVVGLLNGLMFARDHGRDRVLLVRQRPARGGDRRRHDHQSSGRGARPASSFRSGCTRSTSIPAIASGVFVTMMTDCVGFFAFLGLAALWLT